MRSCWVSSTVMTIDDKAGRVISGRSLADAAEADGAETECGDESENEAVEVTESVM